MNLWTIVKKHFDELRDYVHDDRIDPASRIELCRAVFERYDKEAREYREARERGLRATREEG